MYIPFNSHRRVGVNASDSMGRTHVLRAVERGDVREIHKCIEAGADLNLPDRNGTTPLLMAIQKNNLHAVKALLKGGAKVDMTTKNMPSPIMMAVDENVDIAIFKSILAYKPILTRTDSNGDGITHHWAQKGDMQRFHLLREAGVRFNEPNAKTGERPIHAVVRAKRSEHLDMLLSYDIDPFETTKNLETALHIACSSGDVRAVGRLLDVYVKRRGKDPLRTLDDGKTPLICAAAAGHVEVVKLLLDDGVNVNERDHFQRSAIFHAASTGRVDVVWALIEAGADMKGLKSTHASRNTLLHEAVTGRNFEVLSICIKAGLDLNAANSAGETPLMQAVKMMNPEAVRLLIQAGADTNKLDQFGFRPIDMAAQQAHMKHAAEILNLLIQNGADINDSDSMYIHMSPVHLAIQSGDLEAAKPFFERKEALEMREHQTGFTPFLGAVSEAHKPLVKYLQEKGADVKATDRKGCTALHVAVEMGHFSFFPYLIKECGIDPNTKSNDGITPAMTAIFSGNAKTVEIYFGMAGVDLSLKDNGQNTILHLAAAQTNMNVFDAVLANLPKGFDIKAMNKEGSTALHKAASENHTVQAKTLVEMGLSLEDRNFIGATPLMMAVLNEALDTTTELISQGADVKTALDDGSTLVHIATQNCDVDTLEVLIQAGVDVDKADNEGFSPIHHAISQGDFRTLDTLILHGAKTDIKTPDGADLFSFAVDFGDQEIVSYLKEFMEIPPEKLTKAFNKDQKSERPKLNIPRRRLS